MVRRRGGEVHEGGGLWERLVGKTERREGGKLELRRKDQAATKVFRKEKRGKGGKSLVEN